MVDLRLKGICQTCRYWDQRYTENKQLGVCRVMGAHLFPQEDGGMDVAINGPSMYPDPLYPPSSDVRAVRTIAMFGCNAHDPRRD